MKMHCEATSIWSNKGPFKYWACKKKRGFKLEVQL